MTTHADIAIQGKTPIAKLSDGYPEGFAQTLRAALAGPEVDPLERVASYIPVDNEKFCEGHLGDSLWRYDLSLKSGDFCIDAFRREITSDLRFGGWQRVFTGKAEDFIEIARVIGREYV
jgi:hypothetical protein